MTTKTVHCDIVSLEKEIFSGSVAMVIATGKLGDLGIMAGHTPLLTQLVPGPIRLILENKHEEIFYISGGFLEVQPLEIKVLADTVLRATDIDESFALKAKGEAEKELSNQKEEFDYIAAAQLSESVALLRTLAAIRKKTKH